LFIFLGNNQNLARRWWKNNKSRHLINLIKYDKSQYSKSVTIKN
jgi:hypothetical protein